MDTSGLDILLRKFCHDMRNTLLSNARLEEMLIEHYGDHLDERANRWLTLIVNESNSAIVKLNAVSFYTKLLSTHAVFEKVNLRDCLLTAINEMSEVSVKVDIDADIFLSASKELLITAFQEVIDNSIKHADIPATELMIEVSCVSTKDDLHIVLKDNGKGVNQDMMNAILQPLGSNSDNPDSHGLGLNMVELIMNKHQGSYQILSNDDVEGCQVTLEFSKY